MKKKAKIKEIGDDNILLKIGYKGHKIKEDNIVKEVQEYVNAKQNASRISDW